MDVRMQKEMSRSADMMALAMIIVGAIGISVFIALEVLSAVFEKFDYEVMFFILLFAVLLGLGIGVKVLIRKAIKNVTALPKINEYEFLPTALQSTRQLTAKTSRTLKFSIRR